MTRRRELNPEIEGLGLYIYNQNHSNIIPATHLVQFVRKSVAEPLGIKIHYKTETQPWSIQPGRYNLGRFEVKTPREKGIARIRVLPEPKTGESAVRIHVPVDFTHGGDALFHLTSFTTLEGKPLLTVAKNTNGPPQVVLTSHSVDGHLLGELLADKLKGITGQLMIHKEAPDVQVTLVKGEGFKITQRAARRKMRSDVMRELVRLTAELETARALRDEALDNVRLLQAHRLPGLVAGIDRAKVKLAEEAIHEHERLRRKGDVADAEVKRLQRKLEKVRRVAELAGFGSRGKALELIKKLAK